MQWLPRLWRANRCRTHLHIRRRVAAGTEIFWRESSREIEEIYNRLEICKHGEIAAPVHVKERGGRECLATAILETKGAWRKEKYARPEAEVPRQPKKKGWIKGPKFISCSNKREKPKNHKKKNLT